jgi:hypothetical protein
MALLKFKRSAVPAKVPALNDLDLGELAINTYDGKVYTKKDDGTPSIVEIGGVSGGVITNTTIDSITNHVGADHIHYKVKATENLVKGNVVKVIGYNAGEDAFRVAKVTSASDIAIGVVYQAIADGDYGSIINTGALEGINTSAFAIGTVLYPNTSGGFTTTKPTTGRYQALAYVVRSGNNNGTILIEASEPQPTSLSQFTNDSGYITGITSGNVTTALGYTPVNRAGDTMTGQLSITGMGNVNGGNLQLGDKAEGTNKWSVMTGGHYNGVSQAKGVMLIGSYSNSTANQVSIGGNVWEANPATQIVFYTSTTTTHATGGTSRLSINGSGNVVAEVDIRAPIYYDSNDTAYYVDPNSNSNFIVVYASEFYNRGWFRTNDSDKGLYNQATGQHWYSDSGNYWNMGGGNLNGQGIRFRDNHQGTVRGYVYYDQSNNVGFLNNEGNWRARVVGGDYFLADGSSARAQIFYDSNDTTYYINGAGDSVLNTLYMRNGTVQAKFAQASNFGYSSSYKTVVLGNEYLTTISMGVDVSGNASGSFNGQGEGREVLFRNGVTFVTPNSANNNYLPTFNMTDGYVTSGGSVRSPIFYDSNNTGYYLDPNSTSNLYRTNGDGFAANQFLCGTTNYGDQVSGSTWYGIGRSNVTGYFAGGMVQVAAYTGLRLRGPYSVIDLDGAVGGDLINFSTTTARFTGDVRAAIFYDVSDTGYYVDPNSVTRLNKLTAGERSLVGYATLSMASLDQNTWYPVTIPINAARQTRLRIENALNSNAPSWSTHPAGFSCYVEWTSNGAGWGTIGLNRRVIDWRESFTSVQIVGGIDQLTQSSTEVIWLRGGGNYFFSADNDVTPTIRTSTYEINGQSVSPRSAIYNTPWAASTGQTGAAIFYATSTITSATDVRAPIFYDSNDTAYYADFAGTTSLNAVSAGTITATNFQATNAFYVNGTSYYLNSTNGGWYSNARIQSETDMRAPIFYDSNNTAFYIDPSSNFSVRAAYLNGNILINPQSESYGEGIAFLMPSQGTWGGLRWKRSNSDFTGAWAFGYFGNETNNDIGFHNGTNGWRLDHSFNNTVNGSFRAPVFYDSDNTAFYVDGNNGTRLNALYPNAIQTQSTSIPAPRWDCSFYVLQAQHWYSHNGASTMYVGESGDFVYIRGYTTAEGSSRSPIFYDSNNTGFYLDASSTGTSLNVAGSIVAAGNVTAYSDIRVKANVETIPSALNKIDHIRGVTYTRTDLDDKEQRYAGVIAQEIEAVLPEAVRDLGNIKAVDYNATIALLIEAVKELSLKVKTLEEKDN